jgi:hypothetical protein
MKVMDLDIQVHAWRPFPYQWLIANRACEHLGFRNVILLGFDILKRFSKLASVLHIRNKAPPQDNIKQLVRKKFLLRLTEPFQ